METTMMTLMEQWINAYGPIMFAVFFIMIFVLGLLLIGFWLGRMGQPRGSDYQQHPVFRQKPEKTKKVDEPGEYEDP